jgi:hypothetical protein
MAESGPGDMAPARAILTISRSAHGHFDITLFFFAKILAFSREPPLPLLGESRNEIAPKSLERDTIKVPARGFLAESVAGLRVLGQVIEEKLQGDKAAKLGVLSFVDHAHPTTAEPLDDAVGETVCPISEPVSAIVP